MIFLKPAARCAYRGPLHALLFLLVLWAPPACSDGDDAAASRGESKKPPRADGADEQSEPGPGQWRKFRTHKFDAALTDEQREMMERLEAVGYAGGSVRADAMRGVTVLDEEKAFAGLNFYTSGHGQEAVLMDMMGRILHEWSCEFREVWPDYPVPRKHEMTRFWRRALLFENGDVLAVYEGLGLVKLDKDSHVIWASPCRAHHDLQVMPDGDIYVLTREARLVPRISGDHPILEDFVSVLSAGGEEKRRVSLLECFENSEFETLWRPKGKMKLNPDIFHTNTLEVLDGRIADQVPAFAKGRILTSMLNIDAVAVVDLEQEKVIWARTGTFDKQHDPKILENGNLMLFDNNRRTGRSRVIEFDPNDMSVVWMYRGTKEAPFYSKTCGVAQRLSNKNTLITESDNGRAFEVTPDKKIVWQFYNPHRAGKDGEYIAALFEVLRLPPDFPTGWAKRSENKGGD